MHPSIGSSTSFEGQQKKALVEVEAAPLNFRDAPPWLLNLDDPAGTIGHAVIVAADRDEAVVTDPSAWCDE
jgi:hypothetical protein